MPDARERLESALRYERNGVMDWALEGYQAAAEQADTPALRSEALRRQADVHRTRCDWDRALDAAREAAETAKKYRLRELFAEALNAQALVYQSRGDLEQAETLLERALAETEHDRIRGIALQNLGTIAALRGDIDVAESRFTHSYRCFERAGYARGTVIALNNYAGILNLQHKYEQAANVSRQAVAAARAVEDLELVALATLNQAEAVAARGEIDRAEELTSSAYGYFTLTNNSWRKVEALMLMGDLREKLGHSDIARHCYQDALRLAELIDAKVEQEQLRERLGGLVHSD